MSKKRKTKKEKMRTVLRQANVHSAEGLQTSPVYTIASSLPVAERVKPSVVVSNNHYAYVSYGMKKTLFITSILLGISLIFHFFLQNNLLHLSFFGY